ncbi:penicillin acylase family protein [bacterium]|nr:penicillin acylase family protein [bacterium]
MTRSSLRIILAVFFFLFGTFHCGILQAPLHVSQQEISFEQRLAAFPTDEPLRVEQPVQIYWNDFAIPFVHAHNDRDGFLALGAVHAHLRLGQMELLRRLATGRLSEMVGPFARDLDYTLRIIGIEPVSRALAANLDEETRILVEGFVEGVNWYLKGVEELPPEFALFDLEREPWTTSDVVALSRLAGADLSWIFYLGYLGIEDEAIRASLWENFVEKSSASPTSFSLREGGGDRFAALLAGHSRSGSNSVVVSGDRSVTGGALIASDPHLGRSIPNFWLLGGLKSRTFHVVGMMIPGLPFFALGRNTDLGWGGTNMRGVSSHLYELSEEDLQQVSIRSEEVKSRWWFDETRDVRISSFGPIITDSPYFKSEKPLALHWEGHRTDTEELRAFFAMNRARDFEEFREAFRGYAVSAQNFLCADREGNIGQVLAYQQPVLHDPQATLDLVKHRDNPVIGRRAATELPGIFNPPTGFLASANNRPVDTEIPLALSFAHPARYERLKTLLSEEAKVSREFLQQMQRDVYSASAVRIRDQLQELFSPCFPSRTEWCFLEDRDRKGQGLLQALVEWDGRFAPGSRGALAYHLVTAAVIPKLIALRYEGGEEQKMLLRGSQWVSEVESLLRTDGGAPIVPQDEMEQLLARGLREALSLFSRFNSWGDIHRQRVQHPFGVVPLLGSRYRFDEYGAPGGNNTLLKSGHRLAFGKHYVTYGAQSRHISDMSDLDENTFVLFGGQDGWLGSENLLDQLPLWKKGEMVRLPLRLSTIQERFSHQQSFAP